MGSAEVGALGGQVLAALRHIHGLGVVHRDLKPANLIFFAEGHLKLCDFGFARACGGERLHTICGTPVYMAPELTRAAAVCKKGYEGPPVDVWAYGCLLYEMSHSRVAFSGASCEHIHRRIRAGAHAPLRPDLPKGLKGLIKACLCTAPSKRPAADALECPILTPD